MQGAGIMRTKFIRAAFFNLISVCLLLWWVTTGFGQMPQTSGVNYRIYDAAGKPVTITNVGEAMGAAEVVFVGESHNDPTTHLIESELLQSAYTRYDSQTEKGAARSLVLSLEMFERDVQTVLDEYLSDLILERQFLASSRPWSNYQTDYRPLIEFAHAHKLPVVASNAPDRYVSRVARVGRDSLTALSPVAKTWLAPLPYGDASPDYAAKFQKFMETAHDGAHRGSYLLDAQVLRDATMGWTIAEILQKQKKALILHINGNFHSEGRMGIPEQLRTYRPQTRILVITIIQSTSAPVLDAKHLAQLGDFVIITDSAVLPETGR